MTATSFDIRYRVGFRYSEPVSESHNEVRMRPLEDDCQRLLSYRLATDPVTQVLRKTDYWGTCVEHFGVRLPHSELEIVASSSVETMPRPTPIEELGVATLRSTQFRLEFLEYLEPSPHATPRFVDEIARLAAAVGADSSRGSVRNVITAVADGLRRILDYRPGSTEIGMSIDKVLQSGCGVCQDFAHVAIAMLRTIGVPARYVSGYMFPQRVSGEAFASGPADSDSDLHAAEEGRRQSVSVQTHAWIEAAVPDWGWWALDPTNGTEVTDQYVAVGRGRDYGDVLPIRGTFKGLSNDCC